MSAVRATKSIPSEPIAARVDLLAMQDLLYDILATGADAEQSSVSIEAVERFLHEHARSAKSADEFVAFFAREGLTVSARPPRPAALSALPPIQRPVQAEQAVMKFPVELATAERLGDASLSLGSPFAPVASIASEAPAPRRSRMPTIVACVSMAAAVLALAALGYVGYATITDLERRLDHTHAAAQADREAIQALESQQIDLESNVAASAQIIERMDQKSDLILDAIQTPAKKSYRRY